MTMYVYSNRPDNPVFFYLTSQIGMVNTLIVFTLFSISKQQIGLLHSHSSILLHKSIQIMKPIYRINRSDIKKI